MEVDVPGGRAALSPDGRLAIVLTDGRYPDASDGAHLNETITETEEIVWGGAVFELARPHEVVVARAGDVVPLPPGRPYSVSGKCVSLVRMDAPWNPAQKRYVPMPAAGDR